MVGGSNREDRQLPSSPVPFGIPKEYHALGRRRPGAAVGGKDLGVVSGRLVPTSLRAETGICAGRES